MLRTSRENVLILVLWILGGTSIAPGCNRDRDIPHMSHDQRALGAKEQMIHVPWKMTRAGRKNPSDSESPHPNDQELVSLETVFWTPTPRIRWTSEPLAERYQILFDDSEECTNPMVSISTTDTQIQIDRYLKNGLYYACIEARNALGETIATIHAPITIRSYGYADPNIQNNLGASGAPIESGGVLPLSLLQADYPRNSSQLNPTSQLSMYPRSLGIFSDPSDGYRLKLIVVDREWNRVLIYSQIPMDESAEPDIVVGQKDFTSAAPNLGGSISASGLNGPTHAYVCPTGQLIVTDQKNNRLLVWQHIPTKNGVSADLVIGQMDFDENIPDIAPHKLNSPNAAYCTSNNLYVSDAGNHRILVYKKFPTEFAQDADLVIGQKDLWSNENKCDEFHLNYPSDLIVNHNMLFITDSGHNRVAIFHALPRENGERISQILGQKNPRSCESNRKGGQKLITNNTLNGPSGIAIKAHTLAVSDTNNHRILLYNLNSLNKNEAYDVIGQSDFSAIQLSSYPEADSVGSPTSLVFDGGFLWASDPIFQRITRIKLPDLL